MVKLSYDMILKRDAEEYNSCIFKWDCDHCERDLCIRIVALADFPSKYGFFKIIGVENNKDKKDHIIVVKGDVVGRADVLVRLHSSCLTGDALGSLRCDCGDQLRSSLLKMEKESLGVLLYMQQEGRDIGLTNKIRTYMAQDKGMDTIDANISLGFEPDRRQYELAAAMLKKLEVRSIRLLTNNPAKIEELEKFGILIRKRISLEIRPNKFNLFYLQTKKERLGHLLSLEIDSEEESKK